MKKVILSLILCFLIIGCYVSVTRFTKKSETVYIKAHEITTEYLKDDKGKLVTIKYVNINCKSVELVLYDDNTYELIDGTNNNQKGTYDFNVASLFGLVSAEKLSDSNKDVDWVRYTLTTGKGEVYISNDNNIPLNNLLEQLNIKLDTCKH